MKKYERLLQKAKTLEKAVKMWICLMLIQIIVKSALLIADFVYDFKIKSISTAICICDGFGMIIAGIGVGIILIGFILNHKLNIAEREDVDG